MKYRSREIWKGGGRGRREERGKEEGEKDKVKMINRFQRLYNCCFNVALSG